MSSTHPLSLIIGLLLYCESSSLLAGQVLKQLPATIVWGDATNGLTLGILLETNSFGSERVLSAVIAISNGTTNHVLYLRLPDDKDGLLMSLFRTNKSPEIVASVGISTRAFLVKKYESRARHIKKNFRFRMVRVDEPSFINDISLSAVFRKQKPGNYLLVIEQRLFVGRPTEDRFQPIVLPSLTIPIALPENR